VGQCARRRDQEHEQGCPEHGERRARDAVGAAGRKRSREDEADRNERERHAQCDVKGVDRDAVAEEMRAGTSLVRTMGARDFFR